MARKVVVMPCSGIGKPSGEIGRQTAMEVTRKLRPEKARMECLARLMMDDPEVVSLVRDNYVITLDGCPDDCARKNVERVGKQVDRAVHVADILAENTDLIPVGILNLGEAGQQLVELLAVRIAAQVDELTGKED
jgi:uncharacterized metal-binding protein